MVAGSRDDRTAALVPLQLHADPKAIATIVDESIATNEESSRESLDLANILLGAVSWDELPSSVTPHFGTDDVRFQIGTLTALLARGDINHIAPDSLRASLIAYGATIDWAEGFVTGNDATLWANFRDYVRAEQQLYEREADRSVQSRLSTMGPVEALRQFDLRVLDAYPEIQATFRLHGMALANRNYVLADVAAEKRTHQTGRLKSDHHGRDFRLAETSAATGREASSGQPSWRRPWHSQVVDKPSLRMNNVSLEPQYSMSTFIHRGCKCHGA